MFSINYINIRFLESTLTNMVDNDDNYTKNETYLSRYIVHVLYSTL